MSWFMVGGATLGAGVGSYGHDNWGWSKDAISQGAAVGAGGGYMAGGAGAAGTATSRLMGPPVSLAGPGAVSNAGGIAGLSGALTKPLVSGVAGSNPLMLGAAGLTMASAFSSQGSAYQDKIELSKEGKQLQKDYLSAAKTKMNKAKAGNVTDKAFQDISNAKSAEGYRYRVTQGAINTVQATAGNAPKSKRGTAMIGGGFVKAQLADTAERMTGLFAPTSILNNYRKEELLNATKAIQNLSNIDNQTAVFNYGSSLSKWGANQAVATEKGAALGSVARMFGNAQLNTAYMDQMKIAS